MNDYNLKKQNYYSSHIFSLNLKKITLGVIILIILSLIGLSISNTIIGKDKIEYKEIKISKGDTLWKIVQKNYGNRYNPRKIIYRIKKINNMSGSLRPHLRLISSC